METYTILREFADSWFLVVLLGFFGGVVIFAFWPSLEDARQDAASIPLRDAAPKCAGNCTDCSLAKIINKGEHHG